MYKCDVCSKEINKDEMKVVLGSKVSAMSRVGFVPSQVGGPLAALGRFSKEQIWATVVNQNPTSDWGFCHSCFYEFETYEQKQQQEEARRLEEEDRREVERRSEGKKNTVIEQCNQNKKKYLNRKQIFIGFILTTIIIGVVAFAVYIVVGKFNFESSFKGTIKSGVYAIINNQFGAQLELNEHPRKVFLLIAISDAAKSMGTFETNKQVSLKCRKGVPSDLEKPLPAETDIYHIIEFKYVN